MYFIVMSFFPWTTWFVRWWRTLWDHSNSHKHCGVPGCYIKLLSCMKFCVIRIYHVSNLTSNLTSFRNPNSLLNRFQNAHLFVRSWKKIRVLIEGLWITRKSSKKKKFTRPTTSVVCMSEHLDQVAQHPNTASQPLEVLLHYGQQGPRCTQPGEGQNCWFLKWSTSGWSRSWNKPLYRIIVVDEGNYRCKYLEYNTTR